MRKEQFGENYRVTVSIGRADRSPCGRGLHRFGIPRRKKHLQLMGRQHLGRRGFAGWPPGEPPARKSFAAKPKTLAVVYENLRKRPSWA